MRLRGSSTITGYRSPLISTITGPSSLKHARFVAPPVDEHGPDARRHLNHGRFTVALPSARGIRPARAGNARHPSRDRSRFEIERTFADDDSCGASREGPSTSLNLEADPGVAIPWTVRPHMAEPGIIARVWRRWKAAFQESVRQQITLSGVVFTALMTLVGIAAFASANNLLFLLFAALLSTMLVSGLVSRLGLAGLELGLHLPEHIAARQRVFGRVAVRNSKFTPSFSIHLRGGASSGLASEIYFPLLMARSRTEEPAEIEFAHRGIFKENEFRVSQPLSVRLYRAACLRPARARGDRVPQHRSAARLRGNLSTPWPATSRSGIADAATTSIASVRTSSTRAPATSTGRRRRTPATCRCASSPKRRTAA